MNDDDPKREETTVKKPSFSLPPLIPTVCGAVASLFAVSLPLTFLILVFGELGKPQTAQNGVLLLALLAVACFFIVERRLSKRYPGSTFALSYYAFFALWGTAAFLWMTGADLTNLFDFSAALTRSVLLGSFFRLLIVHAIALLFRIGHEIVRYIRSLPR